MNDSRKSATHILVGGGIGSLAAAVFLIRDAKVAGQNIAILDQADRLGGSLDGSGNPDTRYLVRGARMFERHFVCTFDLLSSIPSRTDPARSIKDDILDFNRHVRGSSNCRLVRDGRKIEPSFGLHARDIVDLVRLLSRSERSLEDRTIESCFRPAFFKSNFWLMWSTTFAFQTWHSAIELRRYFRRFVHLLPGFKQLEGVLRTRYNQYDSIVEPIVEWLTSRGVQFQTGVCVIDAEFERDGARTQVTVLRLTKGGGEDFLRISEHDRVYFTLGSMTESTALGSNLSLPEASDQRGAWDLWNRLAAREPAFGRPSRFCSDVSRTGWTSFTVTLKDRAFFDAMETLTGNVAGTGGLVTLAGSRWILSIVLFHQPHFVGQPEDTFVFWGYGLRGDLPGDFVGKPMAKCTGAEILSELAGHLRLGGRANASLVSAKVITCMMPFITSQFMPRRQSDRPLAVPVSAKNFAILGQYCELPGDVVFTVEYSVRSAMTAVYAMSGHGKPPPPVQRTDCDPAVLWRAAKTLLAG